MRTRPLPAAALALAALLLATAVPVTAKDFRPGDLRVCSAETCVDIVDQGVLNAVARFYYGGPPPVRVPTPRLGKPYFQLRFSNSYVTGIVAMDHLDRFLSYGVNMGQFAPETWYRFPARAAVELRRLTAGIRPLRVSWSAIARSAPGP
jgi:hypothetical protein